MRPFLREDRNYNLPLLQGILQEIRRDAAENGSHRWSMRFFQSTTAMTLGKAARPFKREVNVCAGKS